MNAHERFAEQKRIGVPLAVALAGQAQVVLAVYDPDDGLFAACHKCGIRSPKNVTAVTGICHEILRRAEELS